MHEKKTKAGPPLMLCTVSMPDHVQCKCPYCQYIGTTTVLRQRQYLGNYNRLGLGSRAVIGLGLGLGLRIWGCRSNANVSVEVMSRQQSISTKWHPDKMTSPI